MLFDDPKRDAGMAMAASANKSLLRGTLRRCAIFSLQSCRSPSCYMRPPPTSSLAGCSVRFPRAPRRKVVGRAFTTLSSSLYMVLLVKKDWQSTFTGASVAFDIHRHSVRNSRTVMAAALVLCERSNHEAVLRVLQMSFQSGVLAPLVYFERVCVDETPLRVSVDGLIGLAKLMQSEAGWAAVVRHCCTERVLMLEGDLSTWVQASDKTKHCIMHLGLFAGSVAMACRAGSFPSQGACSYAR